MNVFAVSRHPRSCARALCDKRLNKMILETTQILCTVINLHNDAQVTPYKNSHIKHPITVWAINPKNSAWLYALGIAYGEEIIHRGRGKHSCHLVLEGLTFKWPFLLKYKELEEDEFHNGARRKDLNLDFTHLPVFEAYREYLKARWPNDKRKPKWSRRKPPSWA